METPAESKRIVRFAEFEFDLRAGELRTNGHHVILPEKPFQILAALLERPGEMVTRDELAKRLWPAGTFVDFNLGLNKAVNRLRDVLDDSAEQPRFIETVPKRGYRFVAQTIEDGPANSPKTFTDLKDSDDRSRGSAASGAPAADQQYAASSSVAAANTQSRWKAAVLMAVTLAITMAAVYTVHTWRTRNRTPDIEKIQVTKVTDSGKVGLVAISPDGRYVCYSLRERTGSGLWLHHVATHSDIRILPADAIAFDGLSFSPDGSYIYYVKADKNDPGFKYLYVTPVLGGPSRLLVKDIDSPVSFSPDGRKFVYTRGLPIPNNIEIRIANVDGSGNHLLATLENRHPGFEPGAAWSPDGRLIAVSSILYGKSFFTLSIITVSDGNVRELYSSPRAIGRPLWLPQGDVLLLVMEDQNGRGQLWTISYPNANVRRVTNDLTDFRTRADLTHDAKTMAAVANQIVANVWEAPAGHLDEARQITSIALPLFTINDSPDGHLLAAGQDGALWSMRSDGSQRVPFTDVANADQPTPCGQYVVFTASRPVTTDVLRVDSDGTNPTRLVSGDLASWSLVCSPDGKNVFYLDLRAPHTILRVPIEGGKPVKIAEVLGVFMVGRMSISPNGERLAYPYEEYTPAPILKLAIIPSEGGPPDKVLTAPGGAYAYGSLLWSPDGKGLQYILTENGASNIWEQGLGGGKPQQLTTFSSGQIFDMHWSLDRRAPPAVSRGSQQRRGPAKQSPLNRANSFL